MESCAWTNQILFQLNLFLFFCFFFISEDDLNVTFYQSKPNLHNKFYKLAEQKFSHRKARNYVELLIVMQCQLKCELILYLKAVIVNERN